MGRTGRTVKAVNTQGLRPWKKGQSGNPAGTSKLQQDFRARARAAVDEVVLDRWRREVEEMGPEWIRASELLAAYGYGRPPQALLVATPHGHSLEAQLTVADDVARITRIAEILGAAGGLPAYVAALGAGETVDAEVDEVHPAPTPPATGGIPPTH